MMRVDQQRAAWSTLPTGELNDVIGSGRGLILAPHPDDESLGCGGLIAACCQNDRAPIVVFLTDGGMSHPASKSFPRKRLIRLRECEARTAAGILGLDPDRLIFLRQPDSQAPRSGGGLARVVNSVIDVVGRYDCSCILAPWRFDPHPDHEAAALVAAELANRESVRHVAYPVWGWTLPEDQIVDAGPPAGWRLDISRHLDRKLRAIAAHESQHGGVIRDDPAGFRLPDALLGAFASPFETFLWP